MTFKHIARKIFYKNFLIFSIILSVCTNALCSGELDRKLSLDDLHMVQSQLPENIFIHWIKIGILLHVQPPFLNKIADQCTGNYRETCTKMLHKWLTGGTMSNDMRTPTLRELAIAIGASCGGACPFTATKIFEQHGDGETYENALKNLRKHAKTANGQQNSYWAFVEHLIRTYFLSKENFFDDNKLGKKLSSVHMNYAVFPILFAVLYLLAIDQMGLHYIGLCLCVSTSEVNRIIRQSFISINGLSVMLFELLYYALNNRPKRLIWWVTAICEALFMASPNQPISNVMRQAICQNSRI